eukprot:TRINITY_DN10577_c0_g1_i1.p1 TRINITY_DN10577_c0_g1~~TRINITY_DN10577_c0_g1_i1.p1  ORF type:complete len:794 (-),score=166.55 TRINITY_DN10577_c0_g1_i1:284-2665(-)
MDDASKSPSGAEKEAGEPRIVQLEETVINRIAAGEVVVRPANALKELLENCLDAGSKHISVMAKGGGLKMLRIEDDGHGIRHDDLHMLCERFTTSKLKKYEDLESISTFGFRGEALASISHVAHVTVTTMTAKDSCARVAQYLDGKLKGPARPCAGTPGTTLVVEDMFYNNPTRKQALGKESMEHAKVLEVVQRYAVHYPTVAFSCRKATSSVTELSTVGGNGLTSQDVIATIYGRSISQELFSFEIASDDPKFTCRGWASGPNYSARSGTLILFINNRLVECSPLRRAIEAVYQPVLPRHQHPWVYVALDVDPAAIDVNVHPTKMEVQFLHEESIAGQLQEVLTARLREAGGARTFSAAVPGVLGGGKTKASLFQSGATEAAASSSDCAPPPAKQQRTEAPPAMDKPSSAPVLNPVRVRTDHRQRSLQSMFQESQASQAPTASQAAAVTAAVSEPQPEQDESQGSDQDRALVPTDPGQGGESATHAQAISATRREAFEEAQQLTSIEELREAAELAGDSKFSKSVHQSVYVGPVSSELVLLQCGAALCLANLAILARECAYQRMLRLVGGIGSITLAAPLPLGELLQLGIEDPDSGYDPEVHRSVDVEGLAARFVALLLEKAELLNEYFMLDIDTETSQLRAVPNGLGLNSDLGLSMEGLPLYLLRLCTQVNWEEEKACLDSICRITAEFCVDLLLPSAEEVAALAGGRKSTQAATAESLNAAVEAGEFEDIAAALAAKKRSSGGQELQGLRQLHEAVRRDAACCWPRELARDGSLLDLVSLDQLYKIFERC